jgi:hypothetical protein
MVEDSEMAKSLKSKSAGICGTQAQRDAVEKVIATLKPVKVDTSLRPSR